LWQGKFKKPAAGFGFFAHVHARRFGFFFQDNVKRQAVGIWKCSACKKVIAGGAWTVSTTAAATVRRSVIFFALLCVMRADEDPLLQHDPTSS